MNAERHARTHHPFAIRHSSAENYTHSWQMFTEDHYIIIASLYFFFLCFRSAVRLAKYTKRIQK